MLWSVLPLRPTTYKMLLRQSPQQAVFTEELRRYGPWNMLDSGYSVKIGLEAPPASSAAAARSDIAFLPVIEQPSADDILQLENAVLWRVANKPHVVLALPLRVLLDSDGGGGSYITWRDAVVDLSSQLYEPRSAPPRFHPDAGKRLRVVVKGRIWNPHDVCVGCPRELDRALKGAACYPLTRGCLGAMSRREVLPAPPEELAALPLVLPPPDKFARISDMFPYVPFSRKRQVRIVSVVERSENGDGKSGFDAWGTRTISPARKSVLTRRIRTFMCPGCALAAAGRYAHAGGKSCWLSYARRPSDAQEFQPTCYGPFTDEDLRAAMAREVWARKKIMPWIAHVLAMGQARQPFADNRRGMRSPLIAVMPSSVSGDQYGRFVVLTKSVVRKKYNQIIPYASACAQAGVPEARTAADLDAPAIALKHPRAGYIYRMLNEPRHAMLRIAVNKMTEALQAPNRLQYRYYGVIDGLEIAPADAKYPFGYISVLYASAAAGASYPRTLIHPTEDVECGLPESLCGVKGGSPSIRADAVIPRVSFPDGYDHDDGRTSLTPEKLAANLAYAKYILHGTGERGFKSHAEFERDYASTGTVGS